MGHKIFLSHNYNDKPIVEPVAIILASIFGADAVFYDSWSIQPGDGIIDKMNSGLSAPEFVFFFVSKNSLDSGMVKLEWQNALYAASKGKTKIIPIKVDDAAMPPILMQTLYIDLFSIGIEAAIAQIVGVIQGNASFTPQHMGFSNLTYDFLKNADGNLDISVFASHLLETNPSFLILTENKKDEFNANSPNWPMSTGIFQESINVPGGLIFNGLFFRPVGATITPNIPLRIRLTPKEGIPIDFRGIWHQKAEDAFVEIPRKLLK
ncbi:hypothetical protein GGQ86_002244 [Xanthobacter flavus]|uniref:TIR domain-containing protein n=1 Tax=Xanthobacter flavus TaxID=281 RepID=A0A9W6CDX6_XANFL|nr:toll/interleukin-1 receptor domain-containing protein [Xanthobacter flavus]MDR6333774.1 hypothetical protein [Xanthobacter flavus]GLI20473.1 hypothetical protein XFLAVUS301_01470 [Xanthobacter flavus]